MECKTIDFLESKIPKLPKFIIMCLMGLPGSGKTTLCRNLPYVLGDKYHVLHVCFDHMVQFREEWSDEGSCGKWKSERAKLLLVVEGLIKGFMIDNEGVKSNKTDSDRFDVEGNESTSSEHQCYLESKSLRNVEKEVIFKNKFARNSNVSKKVRDALNSENEGDFDCEVVSGVQVSVFSSNHKFSTEDLHGKYTLITDVTVQDFNTIYKSDKIILLCIDDNFYYHSMRKEWWNLAARYELAFFTLVLSCEIETCIERVKNRELFYSHPDVVNVPLDVINRMSKNIELPNEKLYHWEKYWSVIDTTDLKFTFFETPENLCRNNHISDEVTIQKFEKINKILFRSLLDPAKPLVTGVNSECFIATPSIIHQVDLALRKIVGRSDTSLKANINKRRKGILENLKNGKLRIPKELTDEDISNKEMLEKYVVKLIELEEINT